MKVILGLLAVGFVGGFAVGFFCAVALQARAQVRRRRAARAVVDELDGEPGAVRGDSKPFDPRPRRASG